MRNHRFCSQLYLTAALSLGAAPAHAMVPSGTDGTVVRPGPPLRFRGAATVLGGTPTIVVRGELPKDAIRRVFYVHINEIKHCYQQELQMRPALSGRVVVNFTIDADGQVHDLEVQSKPQVTLNLPSLNLCIAAAVSRWEFPPQAGDGITVVNYPFMLRPRVPDLPAVGVLVTDDDLAALGIVKDEAPPAVDILF